MSWLSKGLKKLERGARQLVTNPKKAVTNIGRSIGKGWEAVDDFVLPAAGFMIGGPAGAAAGSALARGIGDGRFDPGATLSAGAKGYLGGQLAGGIPGLSGAAPAASSAGAGASGGLFSGGAGGVLKGIGRYALDNPELVLGGLSAVQGAREQHRANKLQDEALDLARQPWETTAPLRDMGMQGLMNPRSHDLSHIYSGMSNPFSRSLRPAAPAMGPERGGLFGQAVRALKGVGRMG